MEPDGNVPTTMKLLEFAVRKLRAVHVDTPVLDAEVMLSYAAERTRTELLTHPEMEVSPDASERFTGWVERRADREPLAYIVGEREFYGICFEVTPAVLIPRPETEILVDAAICTLKEHPKPLVVDIGVGSGAVAVSIAKSLPRAIVHGTETSSAALEVARGNGERAGVGDRLNLIEGDLLTPFKGIAFDMIVSNPPYIPTDEIERLSPEIAMYEPRQALDGGSDGLDYYRRLAYESPGYLVPSGILAVEVGAGQSRSVMTIFEAAGFKVRSICDYSGIERVVLAERMSD